MSKSRKPRLRSAKPPRQRLPDVHPDLEGFDVELNRFGQVDMTISIDELNDFLDREVDDPKLIQWGFGDVSDTGDPGSVSAPDETRAPDAPGTEPDPG